MVEGGDFGGEQSECSTHPMIAGVGFTNSQAANQITGTMTGWSAIVFTANASREAFPMLLWQQLCEGISI
jgi:hypothetical protein